VIIDIDDTIIDTQPRTHQIMETVLNRKIVLEDLYTLSQEEIFYKYASQNQKDKAKVLRKQFLDIFLCKDELGIELLRFNKPIPFAVDVLQKWNETYKIIYLTGRLNSIRDQTLNELRKANFPVENADLIMFDRSDWGSGRLVKGRKRLLYSILKQLTIIRVVDDFPGYFPAYKEVLIPDRIGLYYLKSHSKDDYITYGATRVIESWNQLLDE
jgi:hypothetical protein